ncbi:hypothetical protein [Pseudokineococcus lusitanus]|uniref:Uncharacterized protein n=1 Tax=Pseudokineococcus lusitanus TaxID=763993 RepID=A0A3N1GAJ2_9ACTN|nr:hypothetical protein [Pseudokineococcus lusitanus]ROP27256.1 hypothetical protein EDC03_2781 [Pseudokineococcus lusitanus]
MDTAPAVADPAPPAAPPGAGGTAAEPAPPSPVRALAVAVVAAARRLQAAGEPLEPPAPSSAAALCVVEAVWAPRVDAGTTARVVGRCRGVLPPDAGAGDLVAAVDAAGGPAAWAAATATRHRVLPSPEAPLKAEAARAAAAVLVEHGLASTAALVGLLAAVRADDEAARGRWDAVRGAWCAVPGQASGRSWHRLLVLAGAAHVVPDEDVRRAVGRALRERGATGSRAPDPLAAARLLEEAGEAVGASPREVDHLVWRDELRRGRRPAAASPVPPPQPPGGW